MGRYLANVLVVAKCVAAKSLGQGSSERGKTPRVMNSEMEVRILPLPH